MPICTWADEGDATTKLDPINIAESSQVAFFITCLLASGTCRPNALLRSLVRFAGILQVDGYGSYKGLARRHPQIQLAFCLAHARRKFVAVYKATHAPLARDVIASLGEVHAIEARIRGRSGEERCAVRQAETKPIMDALKTRLMTALAELPSRSSLVEAIKYMLGHWP